MSSSRPSSPGNDEAIEARAAAWLAQRDEGLTSDEETKFADWRRADPRHEAAVVRLEATWTALQALRDFRPEARSHPDRDLLERRRGRVIPFWLPLAGVATIAAAVALLMWIARPPPATDNLVSRSPVYATAADGYQRVTLADGSVVELNANSAVRVAFAVAERHVTLLRGEAHFIVAKNKARPFIVEAGRVHVRAVGTAFDVRLAATDVEVLVTEGKVTVRHAPLVEDAHTLAAFTLLKAGERVALAADGTPASTALHVEAVAPEAVQEALAWQAPRLRFVETPLAEVIAQFNRRNPVQLELADATLASWPVDGSFRAENVEAFVRLIESTGGIRAERTEPNRIVLHRGP